MHGVTFVLEFYHFIDGPDFAGYKFPVSNHEVNTWANK